MTRAESHLQPGATGADPGRRSILATGRSPLADEVASILNAPVIHARNLFNAMGELSSADDGDPIAVNLLTSDVATTASRDALLGMKAIDPRVPMVLMCDDPGANGFDHSVFDAVLTAPVTAAKLRDILDLEIATSDDENNENDTDAASEERLGDVDLVRAIRSCDGSLVDRAVRLIVQQTGWSDVSWVGGSEPPIGLAASIEAESRDDGRLHFGWLRSPDASPEDLDAWAEWLSNWMVLSHEFHANASRAILDDLTSAYNRRYFTRHLTDAIASARDARRPVSVMVFDIDDFKHYNDAYGHDAGDLILIETVRFLRTVIRQTDCVCRIGGDEFAVIFNDPSGPREPGSTHPDTVESIARRFQNEIRTMRFPKLGLEAPGSLTISAGLATFPWDGQEPEELLYHADQRAMQSKHSGKNSITFGRRGVEGDSATTE